MKIVVKAEARSVQGTGASRRLRRAEKVPGIVYGGGKDASLVELDHNNLWHQMKHEVFHASILEMELGAEKMQVLLRDYQMHPFKQRLLHVDFQRVAADRKIQMKVPLHFVNAEISPGVKVAGGVAQHVINELNITCLPKDLPEFIEVDLSQLQAGHPLHLSGVKLPAGVEAVALSKGDDPTVASVLIPRVATAEEELAAAAVAPSAAEVATTKQKAEEPGKEGAAPAGKEKDKEKDKDKGDKK